QMTLREGATLGVLTGETNRSTLNHQRGERQRFGMGPFNGAPLVQRSATLLELPRELRVGREALRPADELLVERSDRLHRQRGLDLVIADGAGPRLRLRLGALAGSARLERCLNLHEALVGGIPELISMIGTDDSALH